MPTWPTSTGTSEVVQRDKRVLVFIYIRGFRADCMAGAISIRRGTRKDANGFLGLLVSLANFEKLAPPSPAAKRRILADVFERKRIRLLLAVDAGVPVGYALYFYTYSSFLAKPTLYLEDIFVLEGSRDSGVGRSLFLRCVREAIAHGCGRMEWSVLNWNVKAIRFYRKLGAKKLNEWSVFRLNEKAIKTLGRGAD